MARPKKLVKIILGAVIGVVISHMFNWRGNVCQTETRTEKLPQLLQHKQPLEFAQPKTNQSLIFVGVMTAEKYLETRARAVYNTWGKQIPGQIVFYSSETSYSRHIPLVALSGIDDSYPPQKKSFMMLKHIHDNYIDKYEWFMRADDDVYIRADKLEELLKSVDSRKPLFIGQTGRGKDDEMGMLSLDSDENFCMGGPGIIMSRSTLKKVAPFLEDCLENLYTTHEDVEIGRCVRKYAGISCTWSYEMQVIFYHNNSGAAAFSGNLKQKEVHRAITLHPIKHHEQMYRLHKYLDGLKVQDALQRSILLQRDIAESMKELGYRTSSLEYAQLAPGVFLFPTKKGQKHYLGDTSLLGLPASLNRYKPRTLSDVLEWELIVKFLYSHHDMNPRKRIGSCLKEGLNDIIREIMSLINAFSKQRGRVIEYKEILYGYWRLDPLHGVDLILDMLLVYKKYRGHKMTVQVRRHAYVQQTFSGIFIREVTNQTDLALKLDDTTQPESSIVHQIISKISEGLPSLLHFTNNKTGVVINFLLPLSGRYEVFKRFLSVYKDVCLTGAEQSRLYIILHKNEDSPGDYDKTLNLIKSLHYSDDSIVVIECRDEAFSRAAALQKAIDRLQDDSLMLFIDVDMIFDRKSLNRVRRNTILAKSVYFPVVYSLYNPKVLGYESYNPNELSSENFIDSKNGFWRQFGFGIASMYKDDYKNLGGFNLNIQGWGSEDVTFFDRVVQSNLKIVRSADPGLVHIYHEVNCSDNLTIEQKNMCLGTKGNILGPMNVLQRLFEKYRHYFR